MCWGLWCLSPCILWPTVWRSSGQLKSICCFAGFWCRGPEKPFTFKKHHLANIDVSSTSFCEQNKSVRNPQKLGAGLYAPVEVSAVMHRELGHTIPRQSRRGWGDPTGPLCWHLQCQDTYKHTPGLQGGFVECCLLHLLYSYWMIALCCPQGWQRDREYCWSCCGVLSMSPQINQWSIAGVWSRTSADHTPGHGSCWLSFYDALPPFFNLCSFI